MNGSIESPWSPFLLRVRGGGNNSRKFQLRFHRSYPREHGCYKSGGSVIWRFYL